MDKPGKFALLHTTGEVSAVDVFRKDELDAQQAGDFKRDAVRRAHRPSWKDPIDGQILAIGVYFFFLLYVIL